MRAGVWWSVAALALLAITSALRTPQVEGATRVGRRLSSPSAPGAIQESDNEDAEPTFRPRSSRRREETPPREIRTRTRSRPERTEAPETEKPQTQRNEQFDSRRTYSRTRSRPVDTEVKRNVSTSRDNVIRSRSRQSSRLTTHKSTQASFDVSSPIDEGKRDVTNSDMDQVTRVSPKYDVAQTQFSRRSSTTEAVVSRRLRGRINTRTETKPLDLTVAGTTNTLTVKEPTTARTSDLRSSRKIRYRTRLTETDKNVTDEGITTNEVTKSSQNNENLPSQSAIQTSSSTAPERVVETIPPSTEPIPVKATTNKVTKVVRRPLVRGKVNFRPSVSLPKLTKSDEINEDDNYPESFKALIQSKNASTQASSPTSESLSLKASQKVYKTYSSSPQSTNTDPAKSKFSRFRSKTKEEEETKTEDKEDENILGSIIVPDPPKTKTSEYKPRGVYSARNSKVKNNSTAGRNFASQSSQSSERPVYKFNRKLKITTTPSPKSEEIFKTKRIETSSLLKKSSVRPSYHSRRNSAKNVSSSSEAPANVNDTVTENKNSNLTLNKGSLPRTSYYSHLRNKNKNEVSTTTEVFTEVIKSPAQNKMENSADMPLIFSLLKNPNQSEINESQQDTNDGEKEKKMFIIAVSSKESSENSTENEVVNKEQNSEKKPIINTVPSSKYHANYKDHTAEVSENKEQVATVSTPSIRNIQTRKYGRRRTKSKETNEQVAEVTPKPREKNLRKFSDSFSKITEASTNGIPPEPEKLKSRYSSKYRSSYLDKPFYKPTVPTITSSTAWLKFFVTDHQLAKYVEEPNWFDGENMYVTTEMSRQSFTTPSIYHESSIELVEGEEIQLGPGMNAISFTKSRSTLSSADLRLSESLVKPSHVMNVETLQHSPSVTISIFDALADILTSTPRTPRLSSTTEVQQNQNFKKQTLNGVSNNVNVNSVNGTASQDTFVSTNIDANINTKSVQITSQTTPNVINSLSGATTPSLNTDRENVTPVNTPTIPTPFPTTSVSARKPFAFKILYSDTEPPTDKLSTATEPTSYHPSTDPTMVYNTVSDLLLTNNNLVSSELTSMLTNNIRDIIKNMDADSRSKLSVGMAKLLRNLIPRALDRITTVNEDVDFAPNTTPYSLEEIKDTENIEVDNAIISNSTSIDALQTVEVEDNVNSTRSSSTIPLIGITQIPTQAVNSSSEILRLVSSTQSVPSGQTTLADSTLVESTLTTVSLNNEISDPFKTTPNTTPSTDIATSSVSLDPDTITVDRKNLNRFGDSSNDSTNKNVPLPFFTNAKIKELEDGDPDNLDNDVATKQIKPITLVTKSVTPSRDVDTIDIQDPSQASPLQLWVLSKKARVLQMIEDLIRQHHNELATVTPLTDVLSQENNIPLSNRLNQIINTMSSTTESTDLAFEVESTSPMTTPSPPPFPLSTSFDIDSLSSKTSENGLTTTLTTTEVTSSDVKSASTEASVLFNRLGTDSTSTSGIQSTNEATDVNPSTTPIPITLQVLNRAEDDFATTVGNVETIETTTQENIETTTTSADTETTPTSIYTTKVNVDTTQADEKLTTSLPAIETKSNLISIVNRNQLDVITGKPKKDYVIFGILPNNTVVRKDPNDDILESLTEASPYIIFGVLPNNTVIRRFPNGTRVPRVMQKIDVLPISPWSLRNPYSPIHNNPAIVRPQSNPIRVSTNIVTSTDTSNNGTENRLTNDTVNNQQTMIPSSALNINDSSLGVTTATNKSPAEKSTASHVLSLRTTTMLPSVHEILLNSISSAAKEEMVISSMTSSTHEPRILTLDIDPETKQIRTEKPGDGTGGAVFKFIPIDEVTTVPQDTNVLKLASTKVPSTSTGTTETQTITETNTQTSQIQTSMETSEDATATVQVTAGVAAETNPVTEQTTGLVFTNNPITTESTTFPPIYTTTPTTTVKITTLPSTTTEATTTTTEATTTTTTTETIKITTEATTTTPILTTITPAPTTTTSVPTTNAILTTFPLSFVTNSPPFTNAKEVRKHQDDIQFLQNLLQGTERSAKSLDVFSNANQISDFTTTSAPTTVNVPQTTQQSEEARLLQAILAANTNSPSTISITNIGGNLRTEPVTKATTSRSIEDDIRQFEEDTKLLKALLAATGQNPASLNIPSLDRLNILTTTNEPITTTSRLTTTAPTTTIRTKTTTTTIEDDIKRFQEDTKLLQALLQATGQNTAKGPIKSGITSNVRVASNPTTTTTAPTTTIRTRTTTTTIQNDIKQFQEDTTLLQALLQATGQNTAKAPIISGITSNVRVASNPFTTSIGSNPTTPLNLQPVYTSKTTTPVTTVFTTVPPRTVPVTLQPRVPISTVTEESSTVFTPTKGRRRLPTTTDRNVQTATARRAPSSRFTVTTEVPSTSTFSDEEDLLFLKNLKTVLNTNPENVDPEAALANRIIALAVEKSLNEIESGKTANDGRTGKNIPVTPVFRTTTTTTPPTTTIRENLPSIEDDIKQFQEDTKLLQELLKATGQDPSKFNIPTLTNVNTNANVKVSSIPAGATDDLKFLSNLLASPSPLNEPFDSLTEKPTTKPKPTVPPTYGTKIAVKDNLQNVQDDAKLLKTLIKLQGVQETTTQRSKLAITGQTPDEALQKLIQQNKPTGGGMMSEATKAPLSISTEYGKSNDALLAALLKEQGFGPTTASSLDEQLRLAALLNQVVVTPKSRRTTTPPPPPQAPRRPILDGLAWLWQQWRETSPGTGAPRPNRRPAPSASPTVSSSAATSNRVNWFGSGPFVGNADERPASSNRIPLEPPRAVVAEQTPGRGQLVSAAINVTRAFSQFLGAAIQGAAQTVQNVIRAGQRATTDAYSTGSG